MEVRRLLWEATLLLVLCSAVVKGSNFQDANPCDSLQRYNTFDALNQCLSFQNYSSALKQATLDSLLKTVPSYVFLDPSRDSPDPVNIPMKVDLVKELNALKEKDFSSDVELQEAIAGVFVPLHDAHTGYRKTGPPYSRATFAQPFLLHSYVTEEDGKKVQALQLSFKEEWVSNWTAVYNRSLPNINGWRVLQLDGEDAFLHILNYANHSVGYSKDLGARYNLAVDGYTYGQWGVRPQSLLARPLRSSVQWTVGHPTDKSVNLTLDVPWLGVWVPPAPSSTTRVKNLAQLFKEDMLRLDAKDTKATDAAVFQYDSMTGVVRLTDFNPETENDIKLFINAVTQGMQQLTAANVSRLIVDVRQNGGGDICLGYAFLRFIFPSLSSIWAGKYDMRHSDLFDEFARKGAQLMCGSPETQPVCGVNPEIVGYFTPCAWMNTTFSSEWDVDATFHDSRWYFPGVRHERGGVAHDYTSLIHEGCQEAFNLWIPSGCHSAFDPDNVIVLSDGLCGSTCAVFSRHIQEMQQAKTVVVGGLHDRPMGIASFPGGEVEDVNFLVSSANRYGVQNSSLVPAPIANNVTFRFAIREIYPWVGNSSLPLEFIFQEADFHLDYPPLPNATASSSSTHLNGVSPFDDLIYSQVSAIFDTCAPWGTQPCNQANGTGVHACENGKYSKVCTPVGCNPGYALDTNQVCVPCPAGYWKADSALGSCQPCSNGGEGAQYTVAGWPGANNCPYVCKDGYGGFLCDEDSVSNDYVKLTVGWFVGVVILTFFVAAVLGFVVALFIYNRWFAHSSHTDYLSLQS